MQDASIVALAALEGEWAEDGTLAEVRRAPGHVALDAPALVAGVLCLGSVAAERRVRDAVRRAAHGGSAGDGGTGLGPPCRVDLHDLTHARLTVPATRHAHRRRPRTPGPDDPPPF